MAQYFKPSDRRILDVTSPTFETLKNNLLFNERILLPTIGEEWRVTFVCFFPQPIFTFSFPHQVLIWTLRSHTNLLLLSKVSFLFFVFIFPFSKFLTTLFQTGVPLNVPGTLQIHREFNNISFPSILLFLIFVSLFFFFLSFPRQSVRPVHVEVSARHSGLCLHQLGRSKRKEFGVCIESRRCLLFSWWWWWWCSVFGCGVSFFLIIISFYFCRFPKSPVGCSGMNCSRRPLRPSMRVSSF